MLRYLRLTYERLRFLGERLRFIWAPLRHLPESLRHPAESARRIGDDLRHIRGLLGRWAGDLALAVRLEYRGLDRFELSRRLRRDFLKGRVLGKAAYSLAVVAWAAFIFWGRFLTPLASTPYFRPEREFRTIGFFENGAGPQFDDSWPTLERYPGLLDVISPFWYSVDSSGKILGDGYRPEVMNFARSKGMKVIPLVSNRKQGPGNGFDSIRTPEARAQTVDRLADLVASRGFDGLNLGYGLLPPEARAPYVDFVSSLARALRSQGRSLLVSVFSDVEVPAAISGFFDYRAIGQAADAIILLAYDRSYPATGPGPLAPRSWVSASLDSLLGYAPAGKVFLGVGTHAYDWPVSAEGGVVEYLSTAAALERARDEGALVTWDPVSGQSFYTYVSQSGLGREVWLQDAGHLLDKVALAKGKKIRGIALWRLGFSEEGALEQLAEALGRKIVQPGR
jgi:spore germination protein